MTSSATPTTTRGASPTVLLETFDSRGLVIAKDGNDKSWVGTEHWLVATTMPVLTPEPDAIDRLADLGERVELERHRIGTLALVAKRPGNNDLRVYVRPDGELVLLDDTFCQSIESWFEDEDDEGAIFPYLRFWQAKEKPLGPVGITTTTTADTIHALVMPVRHS